MTTLVKYCVAVLCAAVALIELGCCDVIDNLIPNDSDSGREAETPLMREISTLRAQQERLEQQLQAMQTTQSDEEAGGSVYVRWGHGGCPMSASLVYTGVMAGSHYSTSGGAANTLCLPLTPTFVTNIHNIAYGTAKLYGVEYEVRPHPSNDQDGLCSVCHAQERSTLMIPTTHQCPVGWNRQYQGYLMAGKPDAGHTSTEYICVDEALQGETERAVDANAGVLYFTEYVCGARSSGLPCPPFEHSRIVTCVVCSK